MSDLNKFKNRPALKQSWNALPYVPGSSSVKQCPFCDSGKLYPHRNEEGQLLRSSACEICGQRVRWSDKDIRGEKPR
jgi:uncharacterized protein (DUF983 family)